MTLNAHAKELFYLIDAVGVTESEKIVPRSGTRKPPDQPDARRTLREDGGAAGRLPRAPLVETELPGHRADPEDLRDLQCESLPEGPLVWAEQIADRLEKHDLPPYRLRERPTSSAGRLCTASTNILVRRKLVENQPRGT